jgi:hypothetical protein
MLLARSPHWVHRRVETLTFIDNRVIRRHLSVDFTLPKWVSTRLRTPNGDEVFLVPLTLLERRDTAMNVDVRDEAGGALPLLIRRECTQLTGATLTEMALQTLRQKKSRGHVHPQIVAAIAFVVASSYNDALPYVRSLISPVSAEWGRLSTDSTVQRHLLREDDEFCDFLGAFARSSIVYIPLCNAAGRHRLLKFAFEEEIRLSPDRLSSIGWSPTVATPNLPLVGLAESHHFQLTPPSNVEFTEAGLTARRPCELIRRDVGEPASVSTDTYRQFRAGPAHAVQLHQRRSHQIASGTTWFAMRAERRGLLFGAWVAALLIAAMLTFFALVTDPLVRQPSSSSSLLLLAPGRVAAYLLRPGEHAMARKLLRAPRLFLILEAAMTFAAAAVLIALYPPTPTPGTTPHASDALKWTLRGLAICAVVWLVLLTVSLIAPRARKTDRHDHHGALSQ